jgi:hypothetical protein
LPSLGGVPSSTRIVGMPQSNRDLSDEEAQQYAEADRREVDPPIQVDTPIRSGIEVSRMQRQRPRSAE